MSNKSAINEAIKKPQKSWLLDFLIECLQFGAVYFAALLVGGALLIGLVLLVGWIRSLLGW